MLLQSNRVQEVYRWNSKFVCLCHVFRVRPVGVFVDAFSSIHCWAYFISVVYPYTPLKRTMIVDRLLLHLNDR